jgi:hypothetical protein
MICRGGWGVKVIAVKRLLFPNKSGLISLQQVEIHYDLMGADAFGD